MIKNIHKLEIKTKNIILEFQRDLRSEGKTEATIAKYSDVICRFLVEVGKEIEDITTDDVKSWLDKYQSLRNTTYRNYIRFINVFFKHCVKCEYISKIPTKRYWLPRKGIRVPKCLSNEEYSKLMIYIEGISLRNRLIILILFETGIRAMELIGINIADVDLKNRTILIRGKGKRERLVEISPEICFLLEKYLIRHKKISNALFLSRCNKRISIRQLHVIFKEIGGELGFKNSFHPHVARYTFANRLREKGESMERIAIKMGHEEESTTYLYTFISDPEFLSQYRKIMG